MNMHDRKDQDELRRLLRQGDPADGMPGLSREESLSMRRQVLNSIGRPSGGRWRIEPRLVAAAASILVVIVGLLIWNGTGRRRHPAWDPSSSPAEALRPGAAAVPAAGGNQARTIHFVTSGGTRVIWTLNPDFES